MLLFQAAIGAGLFLFYIVIPGLIIGLIIFSNMYYRLLKKRYDNPTKDEKFKNWFLSILFSAATIAVIIFALIQLFIHGDFLKYS